MINIANIIFSKERLPEMAHRPSCMDDKLIINIIRRAASLYEGEQTAGLCSDIGKLILNYKDRYPEQKDFYAICSPAVYRIVQEHYQEHFETVVLDENVGYDEIIVGIPGRFRFILWIDDNSWYSASSICGLERNQNPYAMKSKIQSFSV